MKKIMVLLMLLSLFACGGGAGVQKIQPQEPSLLRQGGP